MAPSMDKEMRDGRREDGNGVRKHLLLLHDSIAVKFVSVRTAHTAQTHSWDDDCADANTPPTHGLHLFNSFREVNLKCYWNSAIVDTFHNLDYRGCILPSTIFVSAVRNFLTLLRNAWARQMLRSPPGFRIQFIGDVDEIICEPIQQSHFSPLSDSLCWAILHITDTGEEAGVERIVDVLGQHFSAMVQPSLPLVNHTLHRLTLDRKIYHTHRGFFVVTPDTFRYITTSNRPASTHSLTLDCLAPLSANPSTHLSRPTTLSHSFLAPDHRRSLSRQSWHSAADNSLFPTHAHAPNNQPTLLRRYNSLKLPTNKHKSTSPIRHSSTTDGPRSSHLQHPGQGNSDNAPTKKGKGLLRKLFRFGSRRSSAAQDQRNHEKQTTSEDAEGRSTGRQLLLHDQLLHAPFPFHAYHPQSTHSLARPWNSLPKTNSKRPNSRPSVIDPFNPLFPPSDPCPCSAPHSSRSSSLSHQTSLGYGTHQTNSLQTNPSPPHNNPPKQPRRKSQSLYETIPTPSDSGSSSHSPTYAPLPPPVPPDMRKNKRSTQTTGLQPSPQLPHAPSDVSTFVHSDGRIETHFDASHRTTSTQKQREAFLYGVTPAVKTAN